MFAVVLVRPFAISGLFCVRLRAAENLQNSTRAEQVVPLSAYSVLVRSLLLLRTTIYPETVHLVSVTSQTPIVKQA